MNRFTWYQAGDSMEDLLIQSGCVGVYDGDQKQSAFEMGTVSLTLHRIIWADAGDPDCRLILHHSLVTNIEKSNKSMFSRGGKVVVQMQPLAAGQSVIHRKNNGPVAASPYNYVRLVFRQGGEDEFFKKYREALSKQMWLRNSSSSSSSGSRQSHPAPHSSAPRTVGIAGIEKRIAESHSRTNETISQAFEDMSKLMESARDMVTISKSITEKLRQKKGEITEDETIKFKSYLLSLGVSDPVTKSVYGGGSKYYEKLAQELSTILTSPLKETGGMMTLPDVYCRVNRARGLELISPEDLLNACKQLQRLNLPICGVLVVQLREMSVETTINSTKDFVQTAGSSTADDLGRAVGITVILALERLLAAESQAILCRDDSIEGLRFYPNRFIESDGDGNAGVLDLQYSG